MQILTEGHRYALESFENKDPETRQVVQFIEKVQDPSATAGVLKTLNDGTTNEEVLAMLINRLNYLNGKFPCRENSIALTHIETALLWLNKRTADRIARNVEGKALK